MLFPNRAPDPELRPGMGYAGGSHSLLGYEPGADALGYVAARMGYAAEMGYHAGAALGYHAGAALGDFSASMENAAIDAGIAPNDIDLLNSLGATDQDLTDLINGNVSLTALYAKYGVTIPGTSTATGMITPASVQSFAQPAQIPGGSTLLYTANWTAGVGNLSVSPNSAISSLGSQLAAHGMSVISGQATSSGPINYGIQVMVLDTIGNALSSDAKGILDALMHQIVGNNVTATNLSISTTP
jgi:hypothetical protein